MFITSSVDSTLEILCVVNKQKSKGVQTYKSYITFRSIGLRITSIGKCQGLKIDYRTKTSPVLVTWDF